MNNLLLLAVWAKVESRKHKAGGKISLKFMQTMKYTCTERNTTITIHTQPEKSSNRSQCISVDDKNDVEWKCGRQLRQRVKNPSHEIVINLIFKKSNYMETNIMNGCCTLANIPTRQKEAATTITIARNCAETRKMNIVINGTQLHTRTHNIMDK